MKNMKYSILALGILALAGCKKVNECFKCEVLYQTYLYPNTPSKDTSYSTSDKFCNVSREYVLKFVDDNTDTVTLTNRKDANGNAYSETYAKSVVCERYFD